MSVNIDLSKTQGYLEWLKTKLFLDSIATKAARRVVKRGEVYRCNLGMGIGSEENKDRPCVILQYDTGNTASPNTIVAPISHSSARLPIVVPIADKFDSNGKLILDGHVLLANVVCISKARLGDYVDRLTATEMIEVDKALAISVDLKRHYDKLKRMYDDKMDYINKLKDKIDELEAKLIQKEDTEGKLEDLCIEFGCGNISELIEKFQERKAI